VFFAPRLTISPISMKKCWTCSIKKIPCTFQNQSFLFLRFWNYDFNFLLFYYTVLCLKPCRHSACFSSRAFPHFSPMSSKRDTLMRNTKWKHDCALPFVVSSSSSNNVMCNRWEHSPSARRLGLFAARTSVHPACPGNNNNNQVHCARLG
jgi:hypothetical protein